MLEVRSISALDDPILEPYRTLRRPLSHRAQRIFVAEGEKVVRRLLESQFEVVSLLLPRPWFERLQPWLCRRAEKLIPVYIAPKTELEKLTGFSMYQGVLAVGRIPETPGVDELLDRAQRPFLFAAVDGVSNAENLGVLVRNCVAFGVQGLVVGERSSSPYVRRAVRSSMGTIFKLPVVEVANLVGALYELHDRGVLSVAAHPGAERRPLVGTDLSGDSCLVFGSEGEGISAPVLAACGEQVAIPMFAGVDSLNVGCASAVFFYEARRQRGKLE